MSVLLVDDELEIQHLVRARLHDQGIHVTVAASVAEAETAVDLRTFVVVILDLSLPDGSGLTILDRLRASGSTSHIIVLSGSTDEADRILAFQRGADDFVVKPSYVRELIARVRAVRRRLDPHSDETLQIGRFQLDLLSRAVTAVGETVELTAKEFDLLAYLVLHPGKVFDREQLLNAVWRSASEWQQAATVTEHIRRLRKKLEVDPAHPTLITTVRGAGYRLDLPPTETGAVAGLEPIGDTPEAGEIVHVDGRIMSCDQAAADLLGAPTSEAVVNTRLLEVVAPTMLPAARARLVETGTGPARRSELMTFCRGDAGEVTVAVDSVPAEWCGARGRRLRLTPVTGARAELRHMLTGVLGDLTDAVIVTDLHFHIRSWNAAAERLYGWREEEVRGRHVLDVLDRVGDSVQLLDIWERLEQTGRWHGESEQLARDGSVIDVLSSTTLIRDEAGVPLGIVSVNRASVDVGRRVAM